MKTFNIIILTNMEYDMKNKEYFIPDIEDIRIGYECQLKISGRKEYKGQWTDYKFGYDIPKDIFLIENGITTKTGWEIRTSFLTKEQIENEGWIYQPEKCEISDNNIPYHLWFKKDNYNATIYQDDTLVITKNFNPNYMTDKIFHGKCKDINTLRTIEKLLEI